MEKLGKSDNSKRTERHNHDLNTEKMCLSIVPIFNHLESDQMNEIVKSVQSTIHKKGEFIFKDGDPSDNLYVLNAGQVKIYRLTNNGNEHLVSIMRPGDFMGEYALFNKSTHTSYAEAIMTTKICKINRKDLQAFLTKYPAISLKVLSEFARRLDRSEMHSASIATETVEARIALFLAELANSEPNKTTLELPMKRIDMASYLGTTPETITRRLSNLEDKGFIKQITHKKIKITDLDGLLLI